MRVRGKALADRPRVPLHWHYGHRSPDGTYYATAILEGNAGTPPKTYWRGMGCPPECPDPPEPPAWSIGVRPGGEGLPPQFPPEQAHLITPDNWGTVADPADYGEKPRGRKPRGELVHFHSTRSR